MLKRLLLSIIIALSHDIDNKQKLYNFYAYILFLHIGLPLRRPTTFCTTLLSYLKCKIIGISEYDNFDNMHSYRNVRMRVLSVSTSYRADY